MTSESGAEQNWTPSYLILKSKFRLLSTDYPDYSTQYNNYPAQVKYEDEFEEKYRPNDQNNYDQHENGQNYSKEEGEYDDWRA